MPPRRRYGPIVRAVGMGALGYVAYKELTRKPKPPPPPPPPKEEENKMLATDTMPRTSRRAVTRRPRRRRGRVFRKRRIRHWQPASQALILKTHHNITFNPTAGAVDARVYQLNSAYDPTGAFGSGQPLGFDQMTAIYRKYCVVGWKVKVELVTSDNTVPTTVVFYPSTDATTVTTYPHAKELKGSRSFILTPDKDKGYITAWGNVEPWFYGGRKKGKILTDDNAIATYNQSPSRILYGHLLCEAMDETADPATVYCNVTIYQTIIFMDPIVPSRS